MTGAPHMTDTAAAPWSCEFKRNACRNPYGCHCAEIESLQVRANKSAAALAAKDAEIKTVRNSVMMLNAFIKKQRDALAKARVALEAVFVRHESDDELGARTWLECPICRQGPNCSHPYTCPIGAALEAMK
jgi:hypothetical protein